MAKSLKCFTSSCKRFRHCDNARLPDSKGELLEKTNNIAKILANTINKEGNKDCKAALQLMGLTGLTTIIEESISAMLEPAMDGQPEFIACTIQGAARSAFELRTRIGKARMNVICKGQEFIRCVYGATRAGLQIVIAYACQECGHAPSMTTTTSCLTRVGRMVLHLLWHQMPPRHHERDNCLQGQGREPKRIHCTDHYARREARQHDLLLQNNQLHKDEQHDHLAG